MPVWIRRCIFSAKPIQLRSTDSKSLLVQATLFSAQPNECQARALVDSGCSARGLIDRTFTTTHNIPTHKTPHSRTLLLGDGSVGDVISEYVLVPTALGGHHELGLFFVSNLDNSHPLIFGLPWLQRHNPLIDWPSLTVTFSSGYCQHFCWQNGLREAPEAPVILTKPQDFHDLPVPSEPILEKTASLSTNPEPESHRPHEPPSRYQAPSVEDAEEDEGYFSVDDDSPELNIESYLTPHPHRYYTAKLSCSETETRARMIPSPWITHSNPVPKIAGQRRMGKPLQKPRTLPPLSAPLTATLRDDPWLGNDVDLSKIQMTGAASFVHYCRNPSTKAMRITWDELDRALEGNHDAAGISSAAVPDEYFTSAALRIQSAFSHRHLDEIKSRFPADFHSFLDECFHPARLAKITDADIEKFIEGKPVRSAADIVSKLPVWLRDMHDAFLPSLADELPPHRPWDHKIELMPGKEPPYQKNRPFSPAELRVVRKWLDDNLDKGFIRQSRARCAAPLLLAAKPGGGVRICQDYRGLNNVTIKNRYPLPLIRETLDALAGAKVYTKLDVIAAFNKLRIAEGHEWKTAFTTRFGLFETLVMPFGLCNAPASFQNYINDVLFDLLDRTCTAYLDDVLIYSSDKTQHKEHVREVVRRLRDAGLQIDIDKCEFECTRTKYLGLIIKPGGIEMDPGKVKAITEWKAPSTLRDLQRFLGFANFYRRFIRNFSMITRPLNDLLKKTAPWTWKAQHEQAFLDLKNAFVAAPTLATYKYDRKTVLETDASDWASGGVLSQYDDENILRPVAYFSSKHSAQECNYEIYDKELLAIVKCLEEWRPELLGTGEAFEILTDHKNLEYFTTTKALNQRQVRWSEFLSEFNFRIIYRPGSKAVRPDALSRKAQDRPLLADPDDDRIKNRQRIVLPETVFDPAALADLLEEEGDISASPIEMILPAMDKPIDDLIEAAYNSSDMAQAMLAALRNSEVTQWPKKWSKTLRVAMTDCRVIGNRIYYRDRLFAPPVDELRTQIIYRTHSTGPAGHPGRVKTIDLITRTYWWPKMTRDIEEFVKACQLCDRVKASRTSPPGFLKPLPVPFRAWSDISVDYITPLPECQRNGQKFKHIVVVVCRLTKMRHFIPVVTLSAEELAEAFVGRVYCLHGAPDTIVSDRGTQFVSQFWQQLSQRLGVRLRHSSAFHPETDGQTERVNAILEQYLRAFMNFHQDDWVDWLPLAEFASNNTVSETTGVSPFFANYGFNPPLGTEPSKPCPPHLSAMQKREFLKANNIADRFERILTQLKALARQTSTRYEENANEKRQGAPRYFEGQEVYINTRNMKTNRPMKKGDDKWAGPYEILKVYPRSCLVKLPEGMKVFPVFHTSLLRPRPLTEGLPGQALINEAESKNTRGRILERDDETDEIVEKWEFEDLLDCHNNGGLHYLIKWRHHAPSWQPAKDLKGQDEVILEFHARCPDKPGPPRWVKRPKSARTTTQSQQQSKQQLRSTRLRSLKCRMKVVGFAPTVRVRVF